MAFFAVYLEIERVSAVVAVAGCLHQQLGGAVENFAAVAKGSAVFAAL